MTFGDHLDQELPPEMLVPLDAYGECFGGGGGAASIDVDENGSSVVAAAARLDFKDGNVESGGNGIVQSTATGTFTFRGDDSTGNIPFGAGIVGMVLA